MLALFPIMFYPGFLHHLLFMAPFILLSIWAASRVKGTFARYSRVHLRSGVTGGQVAQMILRSAGIHNVGIKASQGLLSDHYNPVDRTVNLSPEVLNSSSAAAVGVAAHEVGHALQHAQAYAPMKLRHAFVPFMGIASSLAMPMIIVGILLGGGAQVPGLGRYVVMAGIGLFSLAVLFHLVTLPVEFDASRRAVAILGSSGVVTDEELVGVRKTLSAAGFTYLAAALAAVAELIYWLLRAGLLNQRE